MLFNPIEPEHRWALRAGAAAARSPACPGHGLSWSCFLCGALRAPPRQLNNMS